MSNWSKLMSKMRVSACFLVLCLLFSLSFPLIMTHSAAREAEAADEVEWFIHTVDDEEGDGIFGTSLAFDPSGNPAISYNVSLSSLSHALKLARWNGSSWDIETVDAGYNGSLAFDSSGNPAIAYRSYLANVLKYARWNGSSWDIQTVDIGQMQYISLAFDPSGNPGIAYSDWSTNELKYAHWNSSSWDIQTVREGDYVNNYASLAFDVEGNPAIASGGSSIQYAHWDGSSWNIQTIPSGPPSGNKFYVSLALDGSGNPYISYYDGNLKCFYWNGSSWDIQTVDSAPSRVGYYISSLALDASGRPAIAYNGNGGLKYAAYDGISWHSQIVDSGDIGYYASLKFDGSGNPAISYAAKGDLRFASTMPMGSPDQPINLSPADGAADVGLPVTLGALAFSDPTPGDTHAASQWQVTYMPGDYSSPAFDSGRDTSNLTQITIPPQTLTYAITYYWHVRYQDSYRSWSIYSSDTRFTTAKYAPPSADFSAMPTEINEGETVIFTDLSSGYITYWLWDLGDNYEVGWFPETKPEEGKLAHTYVTPGLYTVTLRVSTLGGTDVETKENYVSVARVLVQEEIMPDGGSVKTADGRVVINFPAGAVDSTAIITIREESPITAPGGLKAGNTYFTVHSINDQGLPVNTLAKEATVIIGYSDGDVSAAGGNPQSLKLSRYDEQSEKWIVLPTIVDMSAKTLRATTNQFGKWMVTAEEAAEPPSSGLPSWTWAVIGMLIVLIVGVLAGYRLARR